MSQWPCENSGGDDPTYLKGMKAIGFCDKLLPHSVHGERFNCHFIDRQGNVGLGLQR